MTPGSHPASAKATTPIRAIRAHCLECANTSFEVLHCHLVKCPLHPFRLGRNTTKKPRVLSDERRAELSANMRAIAARRKYLTNKEG